MKKSQPNRQSRNAGSGTGDCAELPPRSTTRWVASRKAQVVIAVESGQISLDEAIERYNLSLEEFQSWQRALDRSGVAGLRIVAAQQRLRKRKPATRARLALVTN